MALHRNCATLEDQREAVATLEETERTARRVVGGAHPIVTGIEVYLRNARVVLRARDPGSFQRASEEKLRTRRVVSVADRFRGLTLDGEGLPDELIWKVLSFWRTSRDGPL